MRYKHMVSFCQRARRVRPLASSSVMMATGGKTSGGESRLDVDSLVDSLVCDAPRKWASQIGQDRWVCENIFRHQRGGFFVDIGAWDGVEISNTLLLERHYGWCGMCVEPMGEAFAKLVKARPKSVCVPMAAYDKDF